MYREDRDCGTRGEGWQRRLLDNIALFLNFEAGWVRCRTPKLLIQWYHYTIMFLLWMNCV